MATDIDFSKENEKPCRLPFYSERGGAAEILSVNEFRRATSRKNLVLREEALAEARRAWLPARDKGLSIYTLSAICNSLLPRVHRIYNSWRKHLRKRRHFRTSGNALGKQTTSPTKHIVCWGGRGICGRLCNHLLTFVSPDGMMINKSSPPSAERRAVCGKRRGV